MIEWQHIGDSMATHKPFNGSTLATRWRFNDKTLATRWRLTATHWQLIVMQWKHNWQIIGDSMAIR